jgi:DNA-binding IclR family transcriptional regulator
MTSHGTENTILSVDRAFEILETIRDRGEVGVTEIADQLKVSKSTVHNHLNTMETRGYVVNEDGEYRLGLRFLSFPDTLQKSNRLY